MLISTYSTPLQYVILICDADTHELRLGFLCLFVSITVAVPLIPDLWLITSQITILETKSFEEFLKSLKTEKG